MIGPIPAVVVGAALLLARLRRRLRWSSPGGPTPLTILDRRDDPRDRLLHPADARPRALSLPVLRARRDPRRVLGPLADRLRRPVGHDVPEHVRRPDDALPATTRGSRTGWGSATRSAATSGVTLDRPRGARRRALGVRPAPAGGADGRSREIAARRGDRAARRDEAGRTIRRASAGPAGDRLPTAARARRGAGARRRRRPVPSGGRRRRAPARRGGGRPRRRRSARRDAHLDASRRRSPSSARSAGSARSSRSARSGPIARGRSTTSPAGRLDRLDLWILVVLVASILGIRMFRLVRAVPDALRRGLPRPDGDGVPPGLALRHRPRHLRVDPSAPREVRDGRRPRRAGATTGSPRRATSACRSVDAVDRAAPRRSRACRRPRRRPRRRRHGLASSARTTCATRASSRRSRSPGAGAVAVDADGYRLFIGSGDGPISTFDATPLDARPQLGARAALAAPPSTFGQVDGAITPAVRRADDGRSAARRDEGRPARHARRRLGRDDRHGPARQASSDSRPGGTAPAAGRDAGRGRGPGGRRGGARRRSSAATRRPTRSA